MDIEQVVREQAGWIHETQLALLCKERAEARAEVERLHALIIQLRDTGHELPGSVLEETFVWEQAALGDG